MLEKIVMLAIALPFVVLFLYCVGHFFVLLYWDIKGVPEDSWWGHLGGGLDE